MRRLFLLAPLVLVWLAAPCLAGRTGYFGPSGYSFVPDAFVPSTDRYSGFLGGEFGQLDSLRMFPKFLAVRGSFFSDRLEISLSSTYAFVTDKGFSPAQVADGMLPVVPAAKWSIDDQRRGRLRWGYAAGAMFPYGVYGVSTLAVQLPVIQPEFTLAVANFTQKGYGLAASRLRFTDLHARPLPLAFTGEVGWAGSTKILGETEENFYALGMELNLGRNLTLMGGYRIDPRIYKDLDNNVPRKHQNTDGNWSLRLEFHFQAFKAVQRSGDE